mmetsp:Transcript_1422/g.5507  ORF Transcript_1422/g.5507 Transcript_1422/m.5507 type:complete len:265 (-) Transcript_1422:25-819(-)
MDRSRKQTRHLVQGTSLVGVPLGDGFEGHHAVDVGRDDRVGLEAVGGDAVGDALGVVPEHGQRVAVGNRRGRAAQKLLFAIVERFGEVPREARQRLGEKVGAELLDERGLLVGGHVGVVAVGLRPHVRVHAGRPGLLEVAAEPDHLVDEHALGGVVRGIQPARGRRERDVLELRRRLVQLLAVADLQDRHLPELGLGLVRRPLVERQSLVLERDAGEHEREPDLLARALDGKVDEREGALVGDLGDRLGRVAAHGRRVAFRVVA